jgi:hypothetical protein
MPSQTANLALPYPVGTDLIADGDNAIQALADKLDAILWSGIPTATNPWIAVGSGGTAPAFGVGFGNYGNGFAPVGFRKVGNLVYVRGLIANVSATAQNATFFTLPAGYRPLATVVFPGFSSAGILRVDVAPNGIISSALIGLGAGSYSSLNLPPFAID